MKEVSVRPQPFDQSDHFALKRKAFEHFLNETGDSVEATKMANIVFNVVVLKSSYSASIQTKVDKFLLAVGDFEESI